MVFAAAVLVAACAVAWILFSWQASLITLAVLVVCYTLAFCFNWIWIAVQTAPRDLK